MYFPKNYAHSREMFLKRVEKIPTPKSQGQWEILSRSDNDLFVDHVYLPPQEKSEKLLVLTSGIHGSETYAGAAIQSMFLDEILPHVNQRHTGVLIVHAMNPYGFKHHLRCTESNVNLNRNFSVSGQLYKERNEISAHLCDRFLERKPVTSLRSSLLQKMSEKSGKIFFEDVSLDEFIKGTSPGQFERPEDLEYGGYRAEPQTQLLIKKLAELMPAFEDIIGFDLHTGLGDRNRLHLLTDGPGRSLNPNLFDEVFHPKKDQDIYAFTSHETEGFYPVRGALNSVFGELAKDQQRACSVTMEFGTLGHSLEAQIEGLNGFIVHHQGHFHGYVDHDLKQKSLAANFAKNRPADPEWERAVISSSRSLFTKVLERI